MVQLQEEGELQRQVPRRHTVPPSEAAERRGGAAGARRPPAAAVAAVRGEGLRARYKRMRGDRRPSRRVQLRVVGDEPGAAALRAGKTAGRPDIGAGDLSAAPGVVRR